MSLRADAEPTQVDAFLPVAGDGRALGDAFAASTDQWLPRPRHVGPDHWQIIVHGGPWSRPVVAAVGAPWTAGTTMWRTLSWEPVAADSDAIPIEPLLPALEGEIGLDLRDNGSVTLILAARYHPPGGSLGALLDHTAMHRVARRTLRRFLADVSAGLTAEAMLSATSAGSQGDPPADFGAPPAGA